ncbi:prepilin-type N-terminal cleavage/methylation domain [Enterobacter ludwigii]|nr:prepilin-type N-terminal cleavage/methylation domain-containing protein [Enterobacter ludwigii]CZV24275.1 prepilin-type N-terminal cleavage/methylation domain [Enterobacter ludwigii]
MSLNQQGFSLMEVLIATAISSLLLISASRFLPGLQRAVLQQSGQRELEEEVWQRLFFPRQTASACGVLRRKLCGAGTDDRQARSLCHCTVGCKQ